MTLKQLEELQKLSFKWAEYSDHGKKSEIETLLDLNKEIQEAWESRNNTAFYERDYKRHYDCFEDYYSECLNESFEAELADIFLILVRNVDCKNILFSNCSYFIKNKLLFDMLLSDNSYLRKTQRLLDYCNQNNIDLYSHVKLKLKYNYTREEYKK